MFRWAWLRFCTLMDNWGCICSVLWSHSISEYKKDYYFNVCGWGMSQCFLWRMTLLFLCLSRMRFYFGRVTVGVWSVASISYTLILSEILNMNSGVARVAASSLRTHCSRPQVQKMQPQVMLAYSFIHHIYFSNRLLWTFAHDENTLPVKMEAGIPYLTT